jgi:hypothetical protein
MASMTDIPGATASSYTLTSADLGQNITVQVTATNTAGSANATAAAVGPVTAAVVKSIDGTAGGQFTGAGPGTITLTTTQANDVVVLVYFHGANSGTTAISSVTSPHLTWTKRSNWIDSPVGALFDFEIWWAPAAAVLTSEVITITIPAAIDDAAYHVFGANGCSNISAPWDTHASLATAHVESSGGTATVPGVSTNSTAPMTIGFVGSRSNLTISSIPAGTTRIRADQLNGGGAQFAVMCSFYQNNPSALSGVSYASSASGGVFGMVIDALA